jgi:hypothetical protein
MNCLTLRSFENKRTLGPGGMNIELIKKKAIFEIFRTSEYMLENWCHS